MRVGRVGRLDEALTHARAALSQDERNHRFERYRVVVELLLRLERADEAIDTARRWAAEAGPTPEQRATMAESLARCNRQAAADELFAAGRRGAARRAATDGAEMPESFGSLPADAFAPAGGMF